MKTLSAVDHRVADYDAWKQVYDGVRDLQRAGGVRAHQVLREAGDDKRVIVTHLFDTREEAEAFFANPDLKAAMEQAGVDVSSMRMTFFEVLEDGAL